MRCAQPLYSVGVRSDYSVTDNSKFNKWNRFKKFNRINRFKHLEPFEHFKQYRLILLCYLLVLELGAYLGAMLFFVGRAGRSVQRTAYSGQGGMQFKETGKNTGDGIQNIDKDTNSIFNIHNSEFKVGALALLPLVFVTLHFSYGLGSIWGLITMPFISSKFKVKS